MFKNILTFIHYKKVGPTSLTLWLEKKQKEINSIWPVSALLELRACVGWISCWLTIKGNEPAIAILLGTFTQNKFLFMVLSFQWMGFVPQLAGGSALNLHLSPLKSSDIHNLMSLSISTSIFHMRFRWRLQIPTWLCIEMCVLIVMWFFFSCLWSSAAKQRLNNGQRCPFMMKMNGRWAVCETR